jgi:hypothetical protein
MTYAKPLLRALSADVGVSSCNFHQSNSGGCGISVLDSVGSTRLPTLSGGCVGVTAGSTQFDPSGVNANPILTNTILGVDDNGVSVTPLAGTGLPGTQPIDITAPVGTHGIYVDVHLLSASYAINAHGFGATVLGNTLNFGLP